jgi:hypothetical protein
MEQEHCLFDPPALNYGEAERQEQPPIAIDRQFLRAIPRRFKAPAQICPIIGGTLQNRCFRPDAAGGQQQ